MKRAVENDIRAEDMSLEDVLREMEKMLSSGSYQETFIY